MTRSVRTIAVALTVLPLFTGAAQAQFWDKLSNPKIQVQVKHPPGLGLNVKRIAFGPSRGAQADQFLDALVADFVNNGIEVIDRQHLDALLSEHDFSLSGYVNQASAAKLGEILGPTALVFVNLQRAATEQKQTYEQFRDRQGYTHRRYYSKTMGFVKGSIQTVDLATGRIFNATTFAAEPVETNSSDDQCCAEYPAEFGVLDKALAQAVAEVHRLFLPWSEAKELYFFDDKDCGLKVAFMLLKGSDVEGALRQSQAALEACRTDPKGKEKVMAHATYNVGMGFFLNGEYRKALELFAESQRIKTSDITAAAVRETATAMGLAAAIQRIEDKMVLETALGSGERAGAARAVSGTRPRPSATAAAAPGANSVTGRGSIAERLAKLDEVFKKRLITKAEYDKKRAEILKDM